MKSRVLPLPKAKQENMLNSKFWVKKSQHLRFVKLDKNLNFEKNSFYILFAPLFLIIAFYVYLKKKIIPHPKFNFYFFDGISKNCRKIKENARSWYALNLVYNNYSNTDVFWGNLTYNFFWHSLKNSRALRNRLKLISFLLFKNFEEILRKNKEVRLISIASGSAQGVIETAAEAKRKGILIKGILIDLDPIAIEYSKKLSQKWGVEKQFTFINNKASIINKIGKEFKPNIIEMVGFLEYKPFNKAVRLIQDIYQVLDKEGVFITSQIASNFEKLFQAEVANWPMIYRNSKETAKILSLSGFSSGNYSFYQEPLKIHYIAECKKI